jgi:hypothetical protein
VIPGLDHLPEGEFERCFQPGHLISAGTAAFSTGGPVSNTGLALHRRGKIGALDVAEVKRSRQFCPDRRQADGCQHENQQISLATPVLHRCYTSRIQRCCASFGRPSAEADEAERERASHGREAHSSVPGLDQG